MACWFRKWNVEFLVHFRSSRYLHTGLVPKKYFPTTNQWRVVLCALWHKIVLCRNVCTDPSQSDQAYLLDSTSPPYCTQQCRHAVCTSHHQLTTLSITTTDSHTRSAAVDKTGPQPGAINIPPHLHNNVNLFHHDSEGYRGLKSTVRLERQAYLLRKSNENQEADGRYSSNKRKNRGKTEGALKKLNRNVSLLSNASWGAGGGRWKPVWDTPGPMSGTPGAAYAQRGFKSRSRSDEKSIPIRVVRVNNNKHVHTPHRPSYPKKPKTFIELIEQDLKQSSRPNRPNRHSSNHRRAVRSLMDNHDFPPYSVPEYEVQLTLPKPKKVDAVTTYRQEIKEHGWRKFLDDDPTLTLHALVKKIEREKKQRSTRFPSDPIRSNYYNTINGVDTINGVELRYY